MHGRSQAGFTLIEILVTLTILGIVLGIIVTRGPMKSPALELRAAAGTVAQTLRAARARAIDTDQTVIVTIDPARHALTVGRAAPVIVAPGVPFAVLDPAPHDGPMRRQIRFAPDGSSTGGGVALGRGAGTQRVTVEWLTGQVVVKAGTPA